MLQCNLHDNSDMNQQGKTGTTEVIAIDIKDARPKGYVYLDNTNCKCKNKDRGANPDVGIKLIAVPHSFQAESRNQEVL